MSDALAFSFYHIFPYRKKLILDNLSRAFPEKSEEEIRKICKKFYSNLSDVLLESMKGFTLSEKQLRKRYVINPDRRLSDYFKVGTSVIGVTAHLTNWEWGAMALGLQVDHRILGVYKKISHPQINKYMIGNRSRFNTDLAEMKEVSDMVKSYNPEKPFALVLIADQRPSDPRKAFWTHFLGRETAFFYGAEKFAMELELPVMFLNIKRKKRGHYEVDLEWISEGRKEPGQGDIITAYSRILEREVRARPEVWLWSHSRWKHPRPEDVPIQD